MTRPPREAGIAPEVAGMLADDTSLAGPGIRVLSAAGGRATARMEIRPDQVNGHGRVHGGLVFMLADTALACASNSLAHSSVTASAGIEFLDGAEAGEVLEATAVVRSRAGRSAVVDVTVRSGSRLVAEFRGRSTQIRGSSGAPQILS